MRNPPRSLSSLRRLIPAWVSAGLGLSFTKALRRGALGLAVTGLFTGVRADVFTTQETVVFPAQIDGRTYYLEARVQRPADNQRHPLVIFSHGRSGGKDISYEPGLVNGYSALCYSLAAKGYAVAYIVRRGYGKSDGPNAEFKETAVLSGLEGAKDYQAAVNYWRTKDFVMPDKIVLMGMSQGGWVVLACTTIPMEGVLGVVNISGGANFGQRGDDPMRGFTPAAADYMVAAAREFGSKALIPSFWIEAENDLNVPAPMVRRMFEAFTATGVDGVASLLVLPPYGDNGHDLVTAPNLFSGPLDEYFIAIGFADLPDAPPVFGPLTGGEGLGLGGTAVLTAAVTGYPPPVLQWRKDGVNLGNRGNLSGAKGDTLRITNLQVTDAGTYTLVATNAMGTAVSFPIIVSFPPSTPVILTQPLGQTVNSGTDAAYAITATGNPAPSYQWQHQLPGSSTWADLSAGGGYGGVASPTLTISQTTVTMSGSQFRCVVSNSTGTITSNSSMLTVNTTPISSAPPTNAGGGGALSSWFFAVLVCLAGRRRLSRAGPEHFAEPTV